VEISNDSKKVDINLFLLSFIIKTERFKQVPRT